MHASLRALGRLPLSLLGAIAGGVLSTWMLRDGITLTPDVAGGGGPAMERIELDGVGRAITCDPTAGRVIVAWNSGASGHIQTVDLTSNSSGTAGPSTVVGSAVIDLGLDINGTRGELYAATGVGHVAVVQLNFGIVSATLSGQASSALSAAAADDGVLIVGQGSGLYKRCP